MTNVFEVVADPMRRRILDLLRDRPHNVGELTDVLPLTQPGISKHLRLLREVGLVKVRQDAQRHWYELRPEPLRELDSWLEGYRHLLDQRFEQLDTYLQQMQAREDDHA